jgi:hypothetical protein
MAAKSSSAIREGDLTGDEAKKEMARRATAITPEGFLREVPSKPAGDRQRDGRIAMEIGRGDIDTVGARLRPLFRKEK